MQQGRPALARVHAFGNRAEMQPWISYAAIAFSFVAAVLGARAATVKVRDSIDDFIGDLQRQGRWASWAAFTAAISVVLQAVDRLAQ